MVSGPGVADTLPPTMATPASAERSRRPSYTMSRNSTVVSAGRERLTTA
jgi:hypothetical protein